MYDLVKNKIKKYVGFVFIHVFMYVIFIQYCILNIIIIIIIIIGKPAAFDYRHIST